MKQIAFGELGLTEKQYNESSPEYLTIAIEGKRKKELSDAKQFYNVARQLAYFVMIAPITKPKKHSPTGLWPLPWDENNNDIKEWLKKNKQQFDKLTLN